MNTSVSGFDVKELDFETATEESQKLSKSERRDGGASTVYTGIHPDYGPVTIIIPGLGESYLIIPV